MTIIDGAAELVNGKLKHLIYFDVNTGNKTIENKLKDLGWLEPWFGDAVKLKVEKLLKWAQE